MQGWYWWRRAGHPPWHWLQKLLISVLLWLFVWQLLPAERKLDVLALVAPPLLDAVVDLLRYIQR